MVIPRVHLPALKKCPHLVLVHVDTVDSSGQCHVSDGWSAWSAAQAARSAPASSVPVVGPAPPTLTPSAVPAPAPGVPMLVRRASEKVSLERYRAASAQVLAIFAAAAGAGHVERASVDEAYLDLTDAVQRRIQQLRTLAKSSSSSAPSPLFHESPVSSSAVTAAYDHDDKQSDGDHQPTPAAAVATLPPSGDACSTSTSPTRDLSVLRWEGHILGADDEQPEPSCSTSPPPATPATPACGPMDAPDLNTRLCVASQLVAVMRARVRDELQLTCSAGIAVNKALESHRLDSVCHSHKFVVFLSHPSLFCWLPGVQVLAKLAAGMHKPDQQTTVPLAAVPALLRRTELRRLRGLGGQLGERLGALGVRLVSDIVPRFGSLAAVQAEFGDKHGTLIWKLGHGACILFPSLNLMNAIVSQAHQPQHYH